MNPSIFGDYGNFYSIVFFYSYATPRTVRLMHSVVIEQKIGIYFWMILVSFGECGNY